jgi:hypothetical protein
MCSLPSVKCFHMLYREFQHFGSSRALLRIGLTATALFAMRAAPASAESRIDLENQVNVSIPVNYPSTTQWTTAEQLRTIGVDRFARLALMLNRDMNELLDSIHRGRPSPWIRRRLADASPAFTPFKRDPRSVEQVFDAFKGLGPCPGDGFSTHYAYVVRPRAVHGIERNPPDVLFPDGFRFALHGDGTAYPHADPRDPNPTFDVELTYAPDGWVKRYRFSIKPCP